MAVGTATAPSPSRAASMKKISIVMSGIDMRLGEDREHLAAGELLDRLGELTGHQMLELVAHVEDALGLAAGHDRLLQSREPAAAHHDDDDVVQRVGLGFHRPAAVVLAEDRDDAG